MIAEALVFSTAKAPPLAPETLYSKAHLSKVKEEDPAIHTAPPSALPVVVFELKIQSANVALQPPVEDVTDTTEPSLDVLKFVKVIFLNVASAVLLREIKESTVGTLFPLNVI